MRSLSGPLLAAQKATSGVPYVRAVVQSTIRDARHLEWASDYTDGSADDEHDAAGDATYLHRARVNGSNAQYQRNASGSWTTLSSTATVSRVAIAAINNTRVAVVYNRGNDIYVRESTDQGGSFGAETLVVAAGAVPLALAVVYKTAGGDMLVLYERSAALRRVRRTAGTWGASAAWTLSAASINGVDVVLNIDFLIVVSGVELTTNKPTVWTCQLGDGVLITLDSWVQQFVLNQSESDEPVTFQAPHLHYLPADGSLRITYVEKFTGTPAYTRTFLTQRHPASLNPLAAWEWTDPAPLSNTTNQGYALTNGRTQDKAFLSRPGEVLAAPTALVTLDMSADLVDATIAERDGLRVSAELVFSNANGQYKGPPAPIGLHHDVLLGLGYDAAYSPLPNETIVGWEYRREGGRGVFVLHTRGNAYWLARSRTRTTVALASVKPTDITRGAAARAGLDYAAVGASVRAGNFGLTWVVHAHENALAALEAVGELLSDVFLSVGLFHRVKIHSPAAGDSVDYAFGTDHAVYRSKTAADEAASFAEIMAEGVLGQALDFGVMHSDKPLQDRRRDPHATAASDANDYAAARLRKAQLAKDLGELVVPPNCGLEIADVVSYTDDLASASTLTARVRSIVTKFRRAAPGKTPVYEQTVGLGGL